MLEDGERRRFVHEFSDQVRCRRQIQDIVVRKLFAVQLLEEIMELPIKSGVLMRVLPVTQGLSQRRL